MEQLSKYRVRLNEIDEGLIKLLGDRFEIIRAVGEYKKAEDIPMMQSKRVEEVKDRCATMGLEYDLDPQFVKSIWRLIIDEACRIEDIIIDEA